MTIRLIAVCFVLAAASAACHAQQVPPSMPGVVPLGQQSPQDPFGKGSVGNDNPMAAEQAAHQLKLQATDRMKRIQADTAKLVALTNELHAEVDKSSKDEMSLDVIRKAAEIEKLAHDVKERMKGN